MNIPAVSLPTSSPNASSTLPPYLDLSIKGLQIARNILAMHNEAEALRMIPNRTASQEKRYGDLDSALNSYDDYLADDLPNVPWIRRALKTV